MKTVCFKDCYATIFANESVPCVVTKFTDLPSSSHHFQMVNGEVLSIVNSYYKKYIRLGICYDMSSAGPVLTGDVEFYVENIIPSIRNIGIRYCAVVKPVRPYTFLTVMPMFNTNGSLYPKITYFKSLRAAYQWLKVHS